MQNNYLKCATTTFKCWPTLPEGYMIQLNQLIIFRKGKSMQYTEDYFAVKIIISLAVILPVVVVSLLSKMFADERFLQATLNPEPVDIILKYA